MRGVPCSIHFSFWSREGIPFERDLVEFVNSYLINSFLKKVCRAGNPGAIVCYPESLAGKTTLTGKYRWDCQYRVGTTCLRATAKWLIWKRATWIQTKVAAIFLILCPTYTRSRKSSSPRGKLKVILSPFPSVLPSFTPALIARVPAEILFHTVIVQLLLTND